jgi:phytoene dehydrogenase-like protein
VALKVADAIVIGAGPNGLVAANLLADAGWDVDVLEAQPEPGGAVRSAELTEPGFVHDVFSSFYPLAASSPAIRGLRLEEHGLRWRHGPLVLAHPLPDGSCATLSRDLDETAASLDAFAAGDGDSWRGLYALWRRAEAPLLDALVEPFPPVGPCARLALSLRGDLARLARIAVLPVRRLGEEHFAGVGGRLLLAGNALHADFAPESAIGGAFGLVLCGLGQSVGFPVPEGGAGRLTEALVRRLESRGGAVTCGQRVVRVLVRRGRAVGVRTEDGTEIEARRAVLADVGAPALYLDLLEREHVPARVLADLRFFERDASIVKLDWALEGPIPWTAEPARRAPTIHVADSVDDLTLSRSELARRRAPTKPFVIFGQYSMADATRMPPGREVAWAYTHVPQGWDERGAARLAERVEARIEALAPGFGALVRARSVLTPSELERRDENLVGGAFNGGTAQLHQQLVFRPTPGLARPETPVRGLYLASASAHPGGGVHGGPGAIAAKAALRSGRAARIAFAAGVAALAAGSRPRRGLRSRA